MLDVALYGYAAVQDPFLCQFQTDPPGRSKVPFPPLHQASLRAGNVRWNVFFLPIDLISIFPFFSS